MSEFSEGYAPGGLTTRAKCRIAGRRSGVRRRQLAWKHRGEPDASQRALRLDYEHRRMGREEFEARYEALWPCPERPTAAISWARGRETLWQHLNGVYALVCARGQHCGTTKGQRAEALSSRGLSRCPRTIRRLNLKLEALGVAALMHRRKPVGQKDCLSIEWRLTRRLSSLHVTPPSGTTNLPPGGFVAVVPDRDIERENGTDSDPPAAPAVIEEPASPAGTESEGLEAEIRFVQLKLEMGFGDREAVRESLWRLMDRRRRIRERGDCASP